MKNKTYKFYFTALVFSSVMVYSQTGRVGVNTNDPKSTMDIHGKKDGAGVLLTTDITGLQAPRMTRAELTVKGDALYGTDQVGAIAYITDVSGGNNTSQRVNVTEIGYYYFDGNVWVKLVDGESSSVMDKTDDEWINNLANERILLGKQSDGTSNRNPNSEFIIEDNGRVSIGDYQNGTGSYFNAKVYVDDKVTNPTLNSGGTRNQGLAVNTLINTPSGNSWSYRGMEVIVETSASNTQNYSGGLVGGRYSAAHRGSGLVNDVWAGYGYATATGSGTINTLRGLVNDVNVQGSFSGTIAGPMIGIYNQMYYTGVNKLGANAPVIGEDISFKTGNGGVSEAIGIRIRPQSNASAADVITDKFKAIYISNLLPSNISATAEKFAIYDDSGFESYFKGNIRANSFISATTTYPDYVFETYKLGSSSINPKYEFRTLSEIEHYINQNGHLPGVTSYEEIKKADMTIDVAKTAVETLEKVEELYLHLIELNKKVDKLEKENSILKQEILNYEISKSDL